MDNLELFKKHTLIKLIVMSCSTLLPIIVIAVLSSIDMPTDTFKELIPYKYVIVVLTEAWIIWKLVNYIRILKNDDYAQKVYIKKNDERNKFIKYQSNNLAIKLCLYILLVAMVIVAFLDKTMFYTLLVVFGIMLIVYGAVRLYFMKKY